MQPNQSSTDGDTPIHDQININDKNYKKNITAMLDHPMLPYVLQAAHEFQSNSNHTRVSFDEIADEFYQNDKEMTDFFKNFIKVMEIQTTMDQHIFDSAEEWSNKYIEAISTSQSDLIKFSDIEVNHINNHNINKHHNNHNNHHNQRNHTHNRNHNYDHSRNNNNNNNTNNNNHYNQNYSHTCNNNNNNNNFNDNGNNDNNSNSHNTNNTNSTNNNN